jgi:thymidylate synthase
LESSPSPYFPGHTLDDVMHSAIEAILSRGEEIAPTKGHARELAGAMLALSDPRARLSRTEGRGKPFSSLGELCWYLSKTNDLAFITYYIPRYVQFADGDVVYGGYGPRLFTLGSKALDQVAQVTTILKHKPHSRQAVVQLFDAHDLVDEHKDVPCTCTLQFMIRSDKLHLLTHMRSNDAFIGLPHDVFCFTMLQEIVARALSVELGTYKHLVGSLHIYDNNRDAAQRFLNEGWQSTIAMPSMPTGDPWPAIASLLRAESEIRIGGAPDVGGLRGLDPYWMDLVRLLEVFRCSRDSDLDMDRIEALRDQLSSDVYRLFVDERIRRVR